MMHFLIQHRSELQVSMSL